MPKPLYACTSCGEQFSRYANGKRHNFNLHNNNGEIVSYTEYLVGRSNNRYQIPYRAPSRRGRYNSYRNTAATPPVAATTTVRDSMGDTFSQRSVDVQRQGQVQPQYQQQQQQYQPYPQQHQTPQIVTPSPPPQHNSNQPMSQYLALREQLLQPRPEQHPQLQLQPLLLQSQPTEKKNSFGLSNETIFKLAELKARLYAHSDIFPNFDVIYQGARHFAITQGDTTFLDEKLAFFRNIDAFGGGNLNQFQYNNVVL
jgi:hypothetical protein